MEITRKLFGMNGQLLELLPVCSKETFDKWKSGELVYLLTQQCFASIELTDERNEKFPDICTEYLEEEAANKFRTRWASISRDEKQEFYTKYMKEVYGSRTYEEFLEDDTCFHFEIPVTVGGKEAVFFFMEKPKSPFTIAF